MIRFLLPFIFFHFLIIRLSMAQGQSESRGMTNLNRKTSGTSPTQKIALIIGNSNYGPKSLPNAKNDATDIAKTLEELGFEVILKENLKKADMEDAVIDFSKKLDNASVGLFYFAGHGYMGYNKDNYLMSVEMRESLTEPFAKEKSVSLESIMQTMKESKAVTKLLFVDACRNNPFRSWGRSGDKGLGVLNAAAPKGMVAFFAASQGEEASENPNARNGLFTQELLKQIRIPNLELGAVLRNISNQVNQKNPYQNPYRVGDLSNEFYFLPKDGNEVSNEINIGSINEQLKKQYGEFINQGFEATNKNNRSKAIELFKKAQSLAMVYGFADDRVIQLSNKFLEKGDKYFSYDEFNTAKEWYLVSQSLKDNDLIKIRISQCISKQ